MVSLGYVRQMKDSKRYRIGRPLFALAASALDEIEMMSLAAPVLDELARDERRKRAFLGADGRRRGGAGAHQRAGRLPAERPRRRGAAGALHRARQDHAGGAWPPTNSSATCNAPSSKRNTPKSITSAERLAREIAEVRRAGLAIDDGEFDPEVRCVALPVRDFSGRVIGAIGISGPVWRLSIEALQKRARMVRAAADRLSAEFGYAGESEPRVKAAV